MRYLKLISTLVFCILVNLQGSAQYNPPNPPEPGALYRVTVRAYPENAAAELTPSMSVEPNTEVTIYTIPKPGYSFSCWKVYHGGDSWGYETDLEMSFSTIIYENVTYEAVFVKNVIQGALKKGAAGTEIMYDISTDNGDGITGMNFDIEIPDQLTPDFSRIQKTARIKNSNISYENIANNKWRLRLSGNQPIESGSGTVFSIPITISETAEDGDSFNILLSNGQWIDQAGQITSADTWNGKITVENLYPDFSISNFTVDKKTVTPGEDITLGWKVSNVGSADALAGWDEKIVLTDLSGSTLELGTLSYDTSKMEPGVSVARSLSCTIPLTHGLEDDFYLKIELTPKEGSMEPAKFQGNNVYETYRPFSIQKVLYLTFPESLVEGEKATAKLTRNGNVKRDENFWIEVIAGDASRITIPKYVSISSGYADITFDVSAVDNNLLDGNEELTIQISGNSYNIIKRNLLIIDNESSELYLSFSKEEITEGETSEMTISIPFETAENLTVKIECDEPSRFSYPTTAIIEKGESSVNVAVKAIDNDIIENDVDAVFKVSADSFVSAEAYLRVKDNDMPTFTFSLNPHEVSESAGRNAILATITRLDNFDKEVVFLLSDNSKNLLSYTSNKVVMKKGQESVQFTIGINDNLTVDEDREVTVTAEVFNSSCNCTFQDTKAILTASVIVIDDDGFSLSITPSSTYMIEGSKDNKFTISQNATVDKDIQVSISSSHDDLLEYNHSATIPAGETKTEFLVNVKPNDISEDDVVVTFKVQADGYAPGTCWTLISDNTLPDATIELYSNKEEGEVGENIGLTVIVNNIGNNTLPSNTEYRIYFSGTDSNLYQTIGEDIEPGESLTLELDFTLPAKIGNYYFQAYVDPKNKVKEQLENNNASDGVHCRILAPFTVHATTDRKQYKQGDSIIITGKATGNQYADADVDIHILQNDYLATGVIKAHTDSKGEFTIVWQPLSHHIGSFEIGGCYPGAKTISSKESFEISGFKTSDYKKEIKLEVGETVTGKISLINPGNKALSGIKVIPKANSSSCQFSFDAPDAIPANSKVELNYTLFGKEPSKGNDWERMPVEIQTSDGMSVEVTFGYYVYPSQATLQINQKDLDNLISINLGEGNVREYPINITNIGKGETGKITVALPSNIELVGSEKITSLKQQESTTIWLRFLSENLPLNQPISGHFGVNCEYGDGLSIPFSLKIVSDKYGTVKIDAIDEYTYALADKPHVSNAKVSISNPVTGRVILEGITNENGIFLAEVPEGTYSMTVEADGHWVMPAISLLVEPAKENYKEVFLYCDGISVEWEVVETEESDEYIVETVTKFETGVPSPVLVVSIPNEKPQIGEIIPISITNKGLIHAIDVEITIGSYDGYKFEFLNEPFLKELGAQQTYVLYARLLEDDVNEKNEQSGSKKIRYYFDCLEVWVEIINGVDCNGHPYTQRHVHTKLWGDCPSNGKGGYSFNPENDGNNFNPTDGNNRKRGSDISIGDIEVGGIPSTICNRGKFDPDQEEENEKPGDGTSSNTDPNGDPLGRPLMDNSEEPEKIDCKESPVLIYKLVPVKGKPYEMKGVGADGVSQLKLVLDPSSKIPEDDCGNISLEWHLSEEYGTIEPISRWEAIYTAPADFGENHQVEPSRIVTATLTYTQNVNGLLKKGESNHVHIEVIRPPLLLIHGLNDKGYNPKNPDSNAGCWTALYKELRGFLYKDFNIERVDYSQTHNSAFSTNRLVVGNAINMMQKKAKAEGYICTKCDLVGHSMGGILSRIHVQKYGDEFVNKLITVNTPHSGSEWGDAVIAHKYIIGNLARLITWNTDIDAVADLAVESQAIKELNSPYYTNREYDVATHSISTQSDVLLPLLMSGTKQGIGSIGNKLITKFPWGTLIGLALKYFEHFLDDVSQVGEGDMIVSTESQKGGYEYPFQSHIGFGPWHCNSPKDYKVIDKVTELLISDKDGGNFARNTWFNPPKRSFDHNKWWALQMAAETVKDMALDEAEGMIEKVAESNKYLSYAKEKKEEIDFWFEKVEESIEIYDKIVNFEEDQKQNSAKRVGNAENGYHCKTVKLNWSNSKYISDPSVIFQFEDGATVMDDVDEPECIVPSTYKGDIRVIIVAKTEDGALFYDDKTITIDSTVANPLSLNADDSYLDVGEKQRINGWCLWDDESETQFVPESVNIEDETIARYDNGYFTGLREGKTKVTVRYSGLETNMTVRVFGNENASSNSDEGRNSICSTVSLALNQNIVMTRQGFKGTLKLKNGSEEIPARDIKLNLVIKDLDGNLATSHEFQVNLEKLDGFIGEPELDYGWDLEGGETGVATIKFVPTKYAAPEIEKDYSFGGVLSYIDPITQQVLSTELIPVTLTVKPSPDIDLHYFMQRDVFGDDPMTEEVEPMIPSEFALVINNKGYGDCKNMVITTHQPVIIENEKGLAIDFQIVSSQLNGEEKQLVFSDAIVNEIGTVAAQSQKFAQWWLTSTLSGHFLEYDVKMTHVTSYDNPDLSLIDKVSIHELTRGFTVQTGERPVRGFLVNEIEDELDLPDVIYFSDATRQDVKIVTNASISKVNDSEYVLQIPDQNADWIYGSLPDPTNGKRKLGKIFNSNGIEIFEDNVWQTDRTMRDGKDPIYENRIHFVRNLSEGAQTLTLSFEPSPEVELKVEEIMGVPAEGEIHAGQLKEVTVKFNKPIREESFTTEDITLTCEGKKVDVAPVVISKLTATDYSLKLEDVTHQDGYYVLTVMTNEILDEDGFNGTEGKYVAWVQFNDGKLSLTIYVTPENGGEVTPSSGRYDYASDIELKAVPADGYKFVGWFKDGESISQNSGFIYHLIEDTELIAEFTPEDSGIDGMNADNLNFRIQPIPVENQMVITGDFNEIKTVSVYDMQGMIHLGAYNLKPGDEIDTSSLVPGIYLITVVTDRGSFSMKLTKK